MHWLADLRAQPCLAVLLLALKGALIGRCTATARLLLLELPLRAASVDGVWRGVRIALKGRRHTGFSNSSIKLIACHSSLTVIALRGVRSMWSHHCVDGHLLLGCLRQSTALPACRIPSATNTAFILSGICCLSGLSGYHTTFSTLLRVLLEWSDVTAWRCSVTILVMTKAGKLVAHAGRASSCLDWHRRAGLQGCVEWISSI